MLTVSSSTYSDIRALYNSQFRCCREMVPRGWLQRISNRKSAFHSTHETRSGVSERITLLVESASGSNSPQLAATCLWKSLYFVRVRRRHSRLNPCSVDVCTGTRADNNCN